ncbi:hypothetical protein EPN18_06545 [bacterium]|nr:MAG: hypothetical protein EPN18_06545 [bacterium]
MYLRLLFLLCFLFAAHLVIYGTTVRFFKVTANRTKNFIFLSASFLSISFIFSRILLGISYNTVTQTYYAINAFWVGFAINLLMASVVVWTIAFIGFIFSRDLPKKAVCSILFLTAFLFSIYGLWSAFNPVIKRIEVNIKGLPVNWQGKTLVQISDVHLGAIHTAGYFSSIAKRINALNPDIIFITGDLFDGLGADGLAGFIEPLNELVAKDGILYVNGNHENYIGIDRVMSVLQKTKLRVLYDDVVNIGGLQIIGVAYPDFGVSRNIVKIITSQKGYSKNLPTILLYHTPTNIVQKNVRVEQAQTSTYWSPDIDYTAAKKLGVNLQLSGHTHTGQFIPFTFLAHYLYKGYEYGLHTDGDFSIYTTNGLGSFGPSMRTGNIPEIVVIKLKPGA